MKNVKLLTLSLTIFLFASGCNAVSPTPEIKPIPSETPTTVPSPTLTITPEPTSTSTPLPAPTLDPMIIHGNAFSIPILEEIANRAPDWEDDFSNPSSGWTVGQFPENQPDWGGGEAGYLDDSYFVSTPSQHHQQTQSSFGSRFANMVFEIDSRFDTGSRGAYEIHIRHQAPPLMGYIISINNDGTLTIAKYISGDDPSMLMEVNPPSLLHGTATNHIQVIASGSDIAVFVNGELAAYVVDPDYERDSGPGQLNIVTANYGSLKQIVFFDNLKLWILPNIP